MKNRSDKCVNTYQRREKTFRRVRHDRNRLFQEAEQGSCWGGRPWTAWFSGGGSAWLRRRLSPEKMLRLCGRILLFTTRTTLWFHRWTKTQMNIYICVCVNCKGSRQRWKTMWVRWFLPRCSISWKLEMTRSWENGLCVLFVLIGFGFEWPNGREFDYFLYLVLVGLVYWFFNLWCHTATSATLCQGCHVGCSIWHIYKDGSW